MRRKLSLLTLTTFSCTSSIALTADSPPLSPPQEQVILLPLIHSDPKFTITGRAIYLKASAEADTVGTTTLIRNGYTPNGVPLQLRSDMSWGANVDLKYTSENNKYELGASWFHANPSWKQGPSTSTYITPIFGDFDQYDSVTSLTSSSRIALNTFDITIGKGFCKREQIELKSLIGLVGITTRQHYNQTVHGYNVQKPTAVTSACNTNGIGLSVGAYLNFIMGSGFSLIGQTKIGLAATYLHSEIKNYDIKHPSEVASSLIINKHFLSSFIHQTLGLQWDHGFNKDKFNLGLSAGWTLALFDTGWNIAGGGEVLQSLLGIQGLALSVFFQF